MEAFYGRMAATVAAIPSEADKALAIAILKYVSCALRTLRLDELADALRDVTSDMLDLEKSIVELCGGFVVIDAGGNVAMVHQTAREYLLEGDVSNSTPLRIDRGEAHVQFFKSCMRSLTTTGLRGKLARGDRPAFLDYAANLWSSHMVMTPPGSENTLSLLQKFLLGPWILIWIQIAASGGKLKLLNQASRSLSKFSVRQVDMSSQSEDGQEMFRKELIDSWAVDLIKITGKFGSILRRNPEAIYKSVPPFCPKSSAIYQQFGKSESKVLQVSGLSLENWDDSFARMAFGAYMSSMAVAASSVAILASSGKVLLYDSTLFEQIPASPIEHQERVYRMELNDSASLLATYGYKNVKVWHLPSGNCKLVLSNISSKPRPLAMRFLNNNQTLLIGSDDRKVRSIDLTSDTPSWTLIAELEEPELDGHFFNSANYMAISRDGSLAAVAYRGHPLSAWETDGPTHVAHCWRKRDEVARGEVIEAIWRPHSPEVIGLYLEGVVFKWGPYDGEIDEMSIGASRLALSKDGNLLSTGDVHGRVKIYTVAGFGLLYQLSSQDTVLGIAFSPDSRRLYDIRGYYGNAWEPNALAKFTEQSSGGLDTHSEAESLVQSSSASDHATIRIDEITALAASPLGQLYCYGTDRGTVSLHSTKEGKLMDIHSSKAFFGIDIMTWNAVGDLIAFSDSSRKLFLVSVSSSTTSSQPMTQTISEVSMKGFTKGTIVQLLFSPDSQQLLVHSTSAIHFLSLPSLVVSRSLDIEEDEIQCIIHPQEASQVLGIGSKALYTFDWGNSELLSYQHDFTADSIEHAGTNRVQTALVSTDKRHVLVQIVNHNEGIQTRLLYSLTVSSIPLAPAANHPNSTTPQDASVAIDTILVSNEISSYINTPLAFMSNNGLIFISKDLVICTWPFRTTPQTASLASISPHKSPRAVGHSPFKELFYLPGDWAGREVLAISQIWKKERTFMCPKNGEIVLVRCAAIG